GEALAVQRLAHRLATPREVPWTLPLTNAFEDSPLLRVPFVQRGPADGLEELAQVAPRDRAEAHRRVVGPIGRRHGFRERCLQGFGEDRHAVDIAELALLGSEAECGVSLDVLDRPIP